MLSLVLALTACGDDGQGTTATESASPTTTETASAATETAMTTSEGTDATGDTSLSGETTEASTGETTGAAACGDDVVEGPTIVRTTGGGVEGTALATGVVAFRGIAYAEPPIGDRRLRPSEPRACQPGITAAQEFGASCVQVEKDSGGDLLGVVGDEDCLTLNVWTPAAGGGDRPVLVFIHGGGNAVGSGSNELYDGARLAEDQDVVVITLNYRLGALGWLTHPDLAAESADGVSGNYALYDQILALEWVRDNVAGFGGDPERVLLFGQSGGAVNTCALLGAPAAQGLFSRSIVMSGTCSQRPLDRFESMMSDPFITNSGCADATDVGACLRELSAEEIITTSPDGYPEVSGIGQGWGPHIDGVVLPMTTLEAMAAGEDNEVPLVVGATAAETGLDIPPLTEAQYIALVMGSFGPFADAVLEAYPIADYGDDPTAAYVALTSDLKFVCSARTTARAAVSVGEAEVYRYHFPYDGYTTLQDAPQLAFHGLDLVYVFSNWGAVSDGNFEYQPNADDLELAALLGGAWARFAATGDPSGGDLPWATYGAAEDNATILDVPAGAVDGVRTAQCDFWEMIIP